MGSKELITTRGPEGNLSRMAPGTKEDIEKLRRKDYRYSSEGGGEHTLDLQL